MVEQPEKYNWKEYQISPSTSLDPVFTRLKTLKPGAEVLNLGSGAGRLEEMAPTDRTYKFHSIEIEGDAFLQHYKKLGKEKPNAQRPGDVFQHADVFQVLDELVQHPEKRPAVMISWRVIHNFGRAQQIELMQKAGAVLERGQEFLISVLSDNDWKGAEARKRASVSGREFKTRELEELVDIMQLPNKTTFKQCFFSEQDMKDLAEEGGFEVVEQNELDDTTGWAHLAKDPAKALVKYRYAVLRKK